jgi:hypothetical protein
LGIAKQAGGQDVHLESARRGERLELYVGAVWSGFLVVQATNIFHHIQLGGTIKLSLLSLAASPPTSSFVVHTPDVCCCVERCAWTKRSGKSEMALRGRSALRRSRKLSVCRNSVDHFPPHDRCAALEQPAAVAQQDRRINGWEPACALPG